jgi:DNA excision repair protein ERCC-4
VPYPPMTIIIDTREQLPYLFDDIESVVSYTTERGTLSAGDYSVQGSEQQICIERKTLGDAYGTFGRGRERFERELQRMAAMQHAVVVIEAAWHEIATRRPGHVRKMTPQAVVRSMTAWRQRFGVHFVAAGNRVLAERLTFRELERWHRDRCDQRPLRVQHMREVML